MTRSIAAFALAGFFALLPVAGRCEPQSADPALALMQRSGLYEQLGTLAPTIEQQLQGQYPSMPIATRAKLVGALREAYAADPLRQTALALIRAGLDADHLRAVQAWLDSAHGRRITELEEQASTPDATRKVQAYAASLQKQPPSAERIAQMQQLDRLSGSSELALEIMMQTAGAVARGLSAVNTGSVPTAEIHAFLEARRPAMKPAVEQSMIVSMLYTYQPLASEELDSYLAFLDSPAGHWYRELMIDATSAAFGAANARLEARLAATPGATARPAAIAK
jgi:hypothetical protein